MNHNSIPAPATPLRGHPTPTRALGRRHALEEAFMAISEGADVILEVDIGMGSHAITAAAVEHAAAHGLIPVTPGRLPRVITPHHVVIVDATEPTAELLETLRADRATVSLGIMLIARPLAPFSSSAHPFFTAIRGAARTITLRPTTRDEVTQIAEDLIRAGHISAMPSQLERQWAWATGAEFARLIESLLRDLDEAPQTEGALARFSRRTIVVASEIVAALPAPLLRLACRLLPLVGTRMSRLVRVLDRVELGLLQEQHIISDADGALRIPAPLQSALRLLSDQSATDDVALSVILDMCAAVDVDADYSEDELSIVVAELPHNAVLRQAIAPAAQRTIYVRAMNLARRRGDNEEAAALARGLGHRLRYRSRPRAANPGPRSR